MSTFKEYIIVGAGPAGLQLGYFFEQQQIDYCILERNDVPGSFFTKFPRHNVLISTNKVYTGYDDDNLNMRWDWNSLLSNNPDLLFKHYSKEYFPKSDDYVKYLNDFAKYNNLNINYNSSVSNVYKDEEGKFHVTCGQDQYICNYLIIATGVPDQVIPEVEGIELCELYSDCSVDPEDYINQDVLIIGKGNSGFETADNLIPTAASIHLISPKNISFAWKTHYVGHVRAVNNNLLDTYLLKSQNALLNAELKSIKKGANGRFVVELDYNLTTSSESQVIEYDRVIIACGFKMNISFFDEACKPDTFRNGKFPLLGSNWESTNIKDLYFAGILTHSRDFKKTTSGFIHGFRYNCEALSKILMHTNHEREFQKVVLENPTITDVADLLIEKINQSSALWQQFGFLGDVLVIKDSNRVEYIEGLPCDYVIEELSDALKDYFIITLEYGEHVEDPFAPDNKRISRFDLEHSSDSIFIHPIIRRYRVGEGLISEFHLIEDLDSRFNKEESHVQPLINYFEKQLTNLEVENSQILHS